ncbi:hypothetical protein EC991_005002 [Linnemannia zychae]|nr:hypothetical protein EC991_005002 [Linnemannia zychae]
MAASADPTSLNPLDLPEIRTYIVLYLATNRADLLACSRVSRAWLQTCLPYLWVSLDLRRFQDHQLALCRQGIVKNGHFIRNVGLKHMQFYASNGTHLQEYVLPHCHHLHRIEFSESSGAMDGSDDDHDMDLDKDRLRLDEWEYIAALVRQNPALEVFSMENSNIWTIPVGFWKALADSALELRSFEMLRATVGIDNNVASINGGGNNGANYSVGTNIYSTGSSDGIGQDSSVILDLFFDICDRVEELHLDTVVFTRARTERWNIGPTFSRLRKLIYFGRSTMQFEFFYRALSAVGLKELTWGSTFRAMEQPMIIAPFLTAEITKRHLALETLVLWEEMPFEDRELQAILLSLSRPLLKLCVNESEFCILALNALLEPRLSWTHWSGTNGDGTGMMASHGSTIRSLSLQGCVLVTSGMIQRLLESCPQLEVFVAWEIKGSDILAAQDEQQVRRQHQQKEPTWACRNLRELEVFISVFSPARDAMRLGTTTAPGYRTTTATASTSAAFGWGADGLESPTSSLSLSPTGMPSPLPPPGMTFFSESERHIHRAIYRELGQLSNLERLVIGKARLAIEYFQNPEIEQGLDLRLNSGLNCLAGLTRLRKLDFRNTPQNMHEQDVEWMAEHFRDMSEVPWGRFSWYDVQRNRDLEVLFQSARLAMVAKQQT